jgi:hypothetical protein
MLHQGRLSSLRVCLALIALVLFVLPFVVVGSRAQAQPTRPALLQRVYFIPLGDLREPDLEAMAGWYRDRYQIPVEVLDALLLGPDVIDARRRQVIAEELMALMERSYPAQAEDPVALLIGVTPDYMYIRERPDWQWAFANRVDRVTVISTFPMDPRAYGERRDPELLASRLRKMVTKSIALQYYGMRLNSDPTSVLYDSVLSADDLDVISEEPDPILRR